MANPRRSVFFVHVMKTGGSALGAALRRGREADRVFPGGDDQVLDKLYVDGLLDRPDEELARYEVFSVHMPAWVAPAVAPDHARVTVLREPVARTVSHLRHIGRGLGIDDLEEVYARPEFRERLGNYQTRLFGERPEEHVARREMVAELGSDADFESELRLALYTAVGSVHELTQDDLAAAIEAIDGFDVVGVTDAFDVFADRLERICGVVVDPEERRNVGDDSLHPTDALLESIRRDNALDLEFYDYVRARALAPAP